MAETRGWAPIAVAALPVLALQLGVGFLRFQNRRKAGVRRFRRALLQAGLSREEAAALAQRYHDAGSVRQFLRGGLASLGPFGNV